MSRLLIEESPFVFQKSLACHVGLKEAIFLQQLKYLEGISKNVRDGEVWVYQTIKEWCEIFPFWSSRTIERIIKSLKEAGILISTDKYNRSPIDKTKWYRLDGASLDALVLLNNKTGVSDTENNQENQLEKVVSTRQSDPSTRQSGVSTRKSDPSTRQSGVSTRQFGGTYNHKTTTHETTTHETTTLHSAHTRAASVASPPDPLPAVQNPSSAKPPKRTRYLPGFERFWYAYTHAPAGFSARTGGKSKAHDYWKRDRLESIADELVAKVEEFWAQDHSWRSGYQPFAQKWLNEKRYDDDPQGELIALTNKELAEKRRLSEGSESVSILGEYLRTGKVPVLEGENIIEGTINESE